MNPPSPEPAIPPGHQGDQTPPSLRRIVRNSALLNAVIIVTSCPILIFAGGPKVVVVTLEIMAGISVLIWTATFALFSLMSLPWIFRTPTARVRRREPHTEVHQAGPADRWLDRPT